MCIILYANENKSRNFNGFVLDIFPPEFFHSMLDFFAQILGRHRSYMIKFLHQPIYPSDIDFFPLVLLYTPTQDPRGNLHVATVRIER